MLTIITNTTPQENTTWNIKFLTSAELENLDTGIQQTFKNIKFTGKYAEIAVFPESSTLFVGLTFEAKQKTIDPFYKINLYNLGAKIYNKIAGYSLTALVLNNHSIFAEQTPNSFGKFSKNLFDLVLGISQASWNLDTYLPEKEAKNKQISVYFDSELNTLVTDEFISNFKALNDGITLTRSLVDDIPENINPTTLPPLVKKELGDNASVEIKHIDYDKMQELGMEGITFVGRSSRHNPTMVHVIIKPKGEVKNKVCLVGKGVTYDSGGLDIKVGGFMKTMKVDMGGSATMFGVMKTLSDMDLQNTEVHWISAWVENMVDGASYKSDDVLTTYSGQTVEIWNTDAEGRLTLADALTLATLQDPDYIIDTATLTGAAVRSVSEHYTAMMGNDYRLISTLEATFIQEGEKTVHTPLPEVLRKEVKGKVGQFVNTSKIGPMAGHLTAGLFLSHFVDQRNFRNSKLNIKEPKAYAWAHLDIAGSVWNKNHNNLEVDGATGQSVRSLAAWILDLDK
jgi:leucyl aminopeptidase